MHFNEYIPLKPLQVKHYQILYGALDAVTPKNDPPNYITNNINPKMLFPRQTDL
jgi:hypothetical protein